MATERAAGAEPKKCPYCLFPILPSENSVVCSACRVPHHGDCWHENRRCTTYGCRGGNPISAGSTGQAATPAPPSRWARPPPSDPTVWPPVEGVGRPVSPPSRPASRESPSPRRPAAGPIDGSVGPQPDAGRDSEGLQRESDRRRRRRTAAAVFAGVAGTAAVMALFGSLRRSPDVTPPASMPVWLVGEWRGTFGAENAQTRLAVDSVGRDTFGGTLTIWHSTGTYTIAVSGYAKGGTDSVAFRDLEVTGHPPERTWSLGRSEGYVGSDRRRMSGTGKDEHGTSYHWSFEKVK